MRHISFPFSLSVGTDIVHLPRIHRLIFNREGRNLIPFAERILHPSELRDLSRRHPRWQEQRDKPAFGACSLTTWLGGRFAAKEAARKAIGATSFGWKDVRVDIKDVSGEPRIIYSARSIDNEEVEYESKLSISHDSDYVMATVLAALPNDVSFDSTGQSRGD
jgi:phosphopantetheine--protein transferase-like protein